MEMVRVTTEKPAATGTARETEAEKRDLRTVFPSLAEQEMEAIRSSAPSVGAPPHSHKLYFVCCCKRCASLYL